MFIICMLAPIYSNLVLHAKEIVGASSMSFSGAGSSAWEFVPGF